MAADITGISAAVSSAAKFAEGLFDRFWPKGASASEKLAVVADLQKAIEERETTIVDAKASIMVAEMNQDDKYTKRGRPTILYGGLLFIFLNHVLFPMIVFVASMFMEKPPAMPALSLPTEFWWAWGGVCSIYVLGRSSEKKGETVGGAFTALFSGKK